MLRKLSNMLHSMRFFKKKKIRFRFRHTFLQKLLIKISNNSKLKDSNYDSERDLHNNS